ncbi:hypothetical protein QAD02_011460 [Eretmocerus hayati]|uniref:Uncharacterized protein n=1 Tax=Eretmocerus hayati TaxID=131215 RepID=A0ACC2NX97_9HYME|nr:hypothetical protein QAD02_011460 [Eretmocerus hayati]
MNEFASPDTLLACSTPTIEAMELYLAHEEARILSEQGQLKHDQEIVQRQMYELGNSRRMLSQKQAYLSHYESQLVKEKDFLNQQRIELDSERAQWASQVHNLNDMKTKQFERYEIINNIEMKLGLMKIELDRERRELADEKLLIDNSRTQLLDERKQFSEEKTMFEKEKEEYLMQVEEMRRQKAAEQHLSEGHKLMKMELDAERKKLEQEKSLIDNLRIKLVDEKKRFEEEKGFFERQREEHSMQIEEMRRQKHENQHLFHSHEMMRIEVDRERKELEEQKLLFNNSIIKLLDDRKRFSEEKTIFEQQREKYSMQIEQMQSQKPEEQYLSNGMNHLVKEEPMENSCFKRSDGLDHPALIDEDYLEDKKPLRRSIGRKKVHPRGSLMDPVGNIKVESGTPHSPAYITPIGFISILKHQKNKVSNSQSDGSQVSNARTGSDLRPCSTVTSQQGSPLTRHRKKLMNRDMDVTHIEGADRDIEENSQLEASLPEKQLIKTQTEIELQARRKSEPWQENMKHAFGIKDASVKKIRTQ